MSTHIGAAAGDIAPIVLMPGDPRRATWIAETFLEDARCYSEIRGMFGYTGTWRGQPVSVQGSGMGQPSAAIERSSARRPARRPVPPEPTALTSRAGTRDAPAPASPPTR